MKTDLGGDRLGSGNKQEVSMRNYSRSTHDLSYLWRSSMSAGTLVPFMSEVGLPGDSFDIKLSAEVLTLPTIGPLFGSYKVQFDVFTVPIRLYQGKLHMNKLGIGLDMSQIKLPQMELTGYQTADFVQNDNLHINSSSIFSYLNIRGLGRVAAPSTNAKSKRYFNAVPYLGYADIYKQYYANKQEEEGVMIHIAPTTANPYAIQSAERVKTDDPNNRTSILTPVSVALDTGYIEVELYDGAGNPEWDRVTMTISGGTPQDGDYQLTQLYKEFEEISPLVGRWSKWNNTIPGGSYLSQVKQQTIPANNNPTVDSSPTLFRFPLSGIDVIRERILQEVQNTDAFLLNHLSDSPFGEPLQFSDTASITAAMKRQEGLFIKTYQSDLFNNWISTEWIDGPNGINEITSVDTTGDKFTIDSLNLANKVYNMLNRIAISGGTYDDWLDAVYTHERTKSVETPVYMGSLIKELSFQEVVSTADATVNTVEGSTNQALGTLAGRGKLTGKNKGGRIKVKVDEPCYIMGIASITPRVDYSQGNKWDVNLKTMDDFHKPALDAIGFQDLVTDQMAWFDTIVTDNPDDALTFKSAGKQPAWINYMTNVNQVRGSFADKSDSMFMVLNRRYESNPDNSGISDLTTYIDPSKFNHIFADTRLDAQNFWVQISNNITARRKMSAKIIPNL